MKKSILVTSLLIGVTTSFAGSFLAKDNGSSLSPKELINKDFNILMNEKDKEDLVLKRKFLKNKFTMLSSMFHGRKIEEFMKYSKEKEKIKVIVTLVTKEIEDNVEAVHIEAIQDESGRRIIFINEELKGEIDIENLNNKALKNIDKNKLMKKASNQISLKKFNQRHSFLNKKLREKIFESGKDMFEVELTKSEIKKLSRATDIILSIEEVPEIASEMSLETAHIRTKVNPYARYGNEGTGISVLISETSGCPANGTYTNYITAGTEPSSHGRAVVNVLKSTSPNSNAVCDANSESRSGFNVQNHSWGYTNYSSDYTTYDRDFDNVVISTKDLIVKSAGNEGTRTGNISSPGKGLNILTVGDYGFDSNDNPTISVDSSYVNPQTKNQKPELTTIGSSLILDGYTTERSGTSFSAPMAAGMAVNYMSDVSLAKHNPQLIKAIMLASSTISVAGGSDKTGEGGLSYHTMNNWRALNTWTNDDYQYYADKYGNGTYIDWHVNITQGNKTAVSISWLNNGNYTYDNRTASHPIGTDFDLSVYSPSGSRVCSSASWDNPYEVCDFTPSESGTYKVRIQRYTLRDTTAKMSLGAAVVYVK